MRSFAKRRKCFEELTFCTIMLKQIVTRTELIFVRSAIICYWDVYAKTDILRCRRRRGKMRDKRAITTGFHQLRPYFFLWLRCEKNKIMTKWWRSGGCLLFKRSIASYFCYITIIDGSPSRPDPSVPTVLKQASWWLLQSYPNFSPTSPL